MEARSISKLAALTSPAGRASVCLVGSETEELEQACGGDTVGIADAENPAGKLLSAGEIISLGAARA
jgi:hypothetical protein